MPSLFFFFAVAIPLSLFFLPPSSGAEWTWLFLFFFSPFLGGLPRGWKRIGVSDHFYTFSFLFLWLGRGDQGQDLGSERPEPDMGHRVSLGVLVPVVGGRLAVLREEFVADT